jgi:hypothetical protein
MRCAANTHGSCCPGVGRTRVVRSLTRALPSRPDVEDATFTSTPERVAAPLLEALVARASTPAAALHVPGHKVCFLTRCHHPFIEFPRRETAQTLRETPVQLRLAAVSMPSGVWLLPDRGSSCLRHSRTPSHTLLPLSDIESTHACAALRPCAVPLSLRDAPWRAQDEPEDVRANLCSNPSQRGEGAPAAFVAAMGADVLRHDLTELAGLDMLSAPNGCIAAAQTLASATFGSDKTWFLVNGSTVGVHAAVLATCVPGDVVVLARNAHQSAFLACVLAGTGAPSVTYITF